MGQPNKLPVEVLFPAPHKPLASECLVVGIGTSTENWLAIVPKSEWKGFLRGEQYTLDALVIFTLSLGSDPSHPMDPVLRLLPLTSGVVGTYRIQMQNMTWFSPHVDAHISGQVKENAITMGYLTGLSTPASGLIIPGNA